MVGYLEKKIHKLGTTEEFEELCTNKQTKSQEVNMTCII